MKTLPVLDPMELLEALKRRRQAGYDRYYAMYSSLLGGLVTDPALMVVPADDHLVHRGDGVFETLKAVNGALYNFDAHLARLRASADRIRLSFPWTDRELTEITVQTVRAGGRREALVRMLVSRGPGGFGVSPAECLEPALYIVVYAYPGPFMARHPAGARACRSQVPPPPAWLAGFKSANYLPNVLIKMDALKAGVDFAFSFDEHGFLAEGATENAGIVTRGGRLQVPRPDRILPGTTLRRVLQLARDLVAEGVLKAAEETDIPYAAVQNAAELLVLGTTPDVTAVVEFDGHPIGDGKPGPVYQALGTRLAEDMLHNTALRTPVF